LNDTQSIPDTTDVGRSSSAYHDSSAATASGLRGGSGGTHINTSFDSVPSAGGGGGGPRTNSRQMRQATPNSQLHSRPSSDVIDRLDDSVRVMLETANLNGDDEHDDDDDVMSVECKSLSVETSAQHSTKRYSSQSYTVAASSNSLKKKTSTRNNGVLSTSVQEVSTKKKSQTSKSMSQQKTVITKGDVVRIHVPYQPDDIVTVVNSSSSSAVGEGRRSLSSSPTKKTPR
jgi:hypothetical protein